MIDANLKHKRYNAHTASGKAYLEMGSRFFWLHLTYKYCLSATPAPAPKPLNRLKVVMHKHYMLKC